MSACVKHVAYHELLMLIHCVGVPCTPKPDGLGLKDVYSCP